MHKVASLQYLIKKMTVLNRMLKILWMLAAAYVTVKLFTIQQVMHTIAFNG